MYDNNQGNKFNREGVTTTVKTLFGDYSSLTVSYWDDKLSLKINPAIGKDDRGLTTYDYKSRAITAFKSESLVGFLKEYHNSIVPVIKDYTDTGKAPSDIVSIAITNNGKTKATMSLTFGVQQGDTEPSSRLVIDMTINNESATYFYKFNKEEVTVTHNGKIDKVMNESELDLFISIAQGLISNLGNSHASRVTESYKNAYKSQFSQNIGMVQTQGGGMPFDINAGTSELTDTLPF